MKARLAYCDNFIEITDFQHFVEEERNGNPYNCAFSIRVKSGEFAGLAEGCEYDYKELQKFIQALEDLTAFRRKEISFVEIGFGNEIRFECDSTGHIKVSGELNRYAGEQFLRYHFMTDQTVFPAFIRELKRL
ncbi:MAG: hypothetical protein IKI58_02810 [Oscillospiraceae bacterium]|nr:hypothetical protein [Oscillospiraceae bacterium]